MERSNKNINSSGWAVIPPEILSMILVLSGMPADEVVCNVALVCRSWWMALKGSYYWSHVDLEQWCRRGHQTDVVGLTVKKLVARSAGKLLSFSAYKLDETTFSFACYRPVGKFLRVLRIPKCDVSDKTFVRHLEFLPVLEELDISYCLNITSTGIFSAGKHCNRLVKLMRNMPPPDFMVRFGYVQNSFNETEGKAVADSMPRLEHLEMGFGMFNQDTLRSIICSCKGLRVLDIRGCFNVHYNYDLLRICDLIQTYKRPFDDIFPGERDFEMYSDFHLINHESWGEW